MAKELTRTEKSLKNSRVALIFSVPTFIITFFSRKLFIDSLGAELLGLNTTITNILQFLNLAEMGIGVAVSFTLYKPLFDKDRVAVNEIVSVQGWLYRRIAMVVMAASVVLMCFFPLIFQKSTLPLWYAYTTFLIFLFGALLGYYVNYKQIILSANQENYKITYSYESINIVKRVVQLLVLLLPSNSYIWWLVVEFIFTIIASITLNMAIKRANPDLKASVKLGRKVKSKYGIIIAKVKQLFAHKIGSFVLLQSQPLIVYAFTSLTLVAYYGNYLLIIAGLIMVNRALFSGIASGVGNLVSSDDKRLILKIFDELYTARFIFGTAISLSVFYIAPDFISLWLGEEYILDNITVSLMLTTYFISVIRLTVDEYIYAYGLFSDTWAPIAEAVLNISLSVLFGYFWGLNGVLVGSTVSSVLIILCWKPYLLFTSGLKVPVWRFVTLFARHILTVAPLVLLLWYFDIDFNLTFFENRYINFIANSVVIFLSISAVLLLLFLPTKSFRGFIGRMLNVVR